MFGPNHSKSWIGYPMYRISAGENTNVNQWAAATQVILQRTCTLFRKIFKRYAQSDDVQKASVKLGCKHVHAVVLRLVFNRFAEHSVLIFKSAVHSTGPDSFPESGLANKMWLWNFVVLHISLRTKASHKHSNHVIIWTILSALYAILLVISRGVIYDRLMRLLFCLTRTEWLSP